MSFYNLINKVLRKQLNLKIIQLRLRDITCFKIISFDDSKQRTLNYIGILIAQNRINRHSNFIIRRFSKGFRIEQNFSRDSTMIQDIQIFRIRAKNTRIGVN